MLVWAQAWFWPEFSVSDSCNQLPLDPRNLKLSVSKSRGHGQPSSVLLLLLLSFPSIPGMLPETKAWI